MKAPVTSPSRSTIWPKSSSAACRSIFSPPPQATPARRTIPTAAKALGTPPSVSSPPEHRLARRRRLVQPAQRRRVRRALHKFRVLLRLPRDRQHPLPEFVHPLHPP